jgi:hypothetical protein
MSFNNRSQFISAQASEKIILAWIEGVERLHLWTLDSGSIYSRSTDYYVTGVNQGTTVLTEVASQGAVVEGTFFYDPATSMLYVHTNGSTNPQTDEEMIVKYRFFYATGTLSAPFDVSDTGAHVLYEGRIQRAPGYKHKIGIEQDLTSLVGGGNLLLSNTDGGLDDIFDTIIFENKDITIFSWNRELPFSEAKVIFRGIVTRKQFNPDSVNFVVKDQTFAFEQEVPQGVYSESDNVANNIKGRQKRWIYGRVEGLQIQSIDQVGSGTALTGTVTGDVQNSIITGTGTLFLSELSPDDTITIGTQEFTVESVESNSKITVDNIPEFSFNDESATVVPNRPLRTKNRTYLVADHACAKITKTLSAIVQLNRVQLSDTDGIEAGDFLEFATGERFEVKNVAPNNIVVLRKNIITIPAISSDVVRQPIQRLFIQSDDVPDDSFTINNTAAATTITLDTDAEFDIARTTSLGIDLTFTNGSRRVTYAGTKDLREIVRPRDFIRPRDVLFSTFYEILSVGEGYTLTGTISANPNDLTVTGTGTAFTTELSPGDTVIIGELELEVDSVTDNTNFEATALPSFEVTDEVGRIEDENSIELRLAFADPNHTGSVEGKLPDYIDDNTIVHAEVLGRTEDNTPSGEWIKTAAQAMRDLITESGLTQVNEASFTQGALDNSELISLALPLSPTGRQTRIKTVIDLLAKSTFSSLTFDNDLKLKFKVLNVEIPDDPVVIRDEDVVSWSINTVNGKNIRNTTVRYRHQDVDRYTLESSSLIATHSSEFVEKYVGTNKTDEIDVYLWESFSSEIMSQRIAYFNSLSRSDMKINTDLRLENIEIGDVVVADFERLYKRFGDNTSRKKVLTVVGKTVTGEQTTLELSDLGNIFNRSSVITPNSAPDFSAADEDEKLKYGYITESNGIVDDDETTANTHLIS